MKKQFLEAGQIVNTHGIRGEVKIVPWGDGPQTLIDIPTLYLDGVAIQLQNPHIHKGNVLAGLPNVGDVNAAMRLKGKMLMAHRADIPLPQGRHFIADLVGLEVRDSQSGQVLGTLTDVLTPPSHPIYVVEGEKNYLIPAVDEFVVETNVDEGYLRVKLIEGMGE